MTPRVWVLGWTSCSFSPSPCTDRSVPLLPSEQNKASQAGWGKERDGKWGWKEGGGFGKPGWPRWVPEEGMRAPAFPTAGKGGEPAANCGVRPGISKHRSKERAAEPPGCCLGGGRRGWPGPSSESWQRLGFVTMFFLLISPTISPRKHNGNSVIQEIAWGIPQLQRVLAGGSKSSPDFPAARPGSK